ncbi:MAG: hypothetical protein ACN2B6_00695, partial [Rickettsiales bacterium]
MAKAPFALVDGKFEPISTVTDYHLCMTFEELEPLLPLYPDRGYGFVMVDGDGFTCIDLDIKDFSPVDLTRRHYELVKGLDTYTEVSQSGCGLHLWLRGEIDGAIKTPEMEVYSRERFIICTGHILNDQAMIYDPAVIDFLNARAKESGQSFNLVDQPEREADPVVLQKCYEGDSSGKFACLMSGDWHKYNQIMFQQRGDHIAFDPSQGDAAFMTIVTYYTRNIEQCKRLWRMSALADITKRYPGDLKEQRRKGRNTGTDYKLMRAISIGVQRNDADQEKRAALAKEAREQHAALIQQAQQAQEQGKANLACTDRDLPPVEGELDYPPGMMGELARYFYRCSIKPIREFAIAEALALASGLFGRAYNVSGTGLNMYLMVLAASGTGKASLSKNPENLMNYLERQKGVVGARQFVMSKRFTHENAMFQEFKERSSFCQCLSEFGKVFKNMVADNNQAGALATVRECMTDMYSKSGWQDVAGGMRYATQERSVDLGYPVAYSFLGESVPEPFFESITPDMYSDGFISRFLIMEHTGTIPYDNLTGDKTPPAHLITHLEQATMGVTRALIDINSVNVMHVRLEPQVEQWFDKFSVFCTDKVNEGADDSVWNSMWTRTNLKVLKLAALIGVMDCPSDPIVLQKHVDWAYDFVMRHNHLVMSSMRTGRVSNHTTSEAMQVVHEIMVDFHLKDVNLATYRVPN